MGNLAVWSEIATVVGTAVVIGGLVAGWVNHAVHQIRDQIAQVGAQTVQQLGQLEIHTRTLTLALHTLIPAIAWKEASPVDPREIDLVRAQLAQMLIQGIRREEAWHNPLSEEELNRLRGYQQRLERGEPLSVSEAEDMKALAERMATEHPNDGTFASLLLLATLFLALLLAPRKS